MPILIKDCGSFGSPLRILALWDFGRLCSTFIYSPAHSAPSSLVPSVCQVLLRKLIVVCLVSPPTLKALLFLVVSFEVFFFSLNNLCLTTYVLSKYSVHVT